MGVYAIYLVFIVNFSFGNARRNYDSRPRISVNEGHLLITVPEDKNISFLTTGKSSGVSINHIDVLTILSRAHNATKLAERQQQILSTYSDRLDVLEQRPLEPIMFGGNNTPSTQMVTTLAFRRLSRRVRMFSRRLLSIERLLYKDECANNPCQNGGTCQDMFNNFLCRCPDGWEGPNCSEDINECARFVGTDLGCQNGATCVNKPGTYECICIGGFLGIHCSKRKADCFSGGGELCGHGTCVSQNNALGYKCICDQGWTTDGSNQACVIDVNECKLNHPPCSVSPHVECINVPGSFYCAPCPSGFTGNGYHCSDVDECATNNGGCSVDPMVLCINTHGSRICGLCPPGYSGDGITCTYQGVCNVNNGGCHNLATCRDNSKISSSYVECICPPGYVGNGIGPNGCVRSSHPCSPNPCKNGACSMNNSTGDYTCTCRLGYSGRNCDVMLRNPCNPNPCLNDGECQNIDNYHTCKCKAGYVGRFCQIQRQACGGFMRGENGTLKYPSGEYEDYNHRANCAWTITLSNSSKVLNITIERFDIEETTDCQMDWLEIHDGTNTAAQTLGRFCGKTLPLGGNFLTTHNSIYLWFRSNADVSGKGFELTWRAVDPKCGGTIAGSDHGSIQSPGAPGNYPLNRDCYWNLLAPFDKRFMFHLFSLDIGENPDCNHDYLKFYSALDGRKASIFQKFCNSTKPAPFYSLGSTAMIHFHSDAEKTHRGFQISYSVVEGTPGCGGVYTARKGTIESVQSTDEFDFIICQYRIQQSIDTKIKITFLKFDLGDDAKCTFNYVELHEGPDEQSPSIGKYCGNNIPAQYISSGNQVTIVSSTLTQVNGWKIKYEKVCGATYVESSGSFNLTGGSDDFLNCVYLIERPPGNKIILTLKIVIPYYRYRTIPYRNTPCFPGYIEVRDGDHENATLIGKYCGFKTINITSSHNTLWMKMPRSFRSIIAEYSSVDVGCGGILRNKFGTISPSVVDGSYAPSSSCTWLIIAPPQNVIQLTWMTFNLEQSYDCSYDNVQVFDNNTDLGMGGLIGKYCGFNAPPILLSSSNMMTVVFTSDVSINMDGFLASYTFIPEKNVCGGSYFTSAGVIKSPRYPEEYPTNRECTWIIHVMPGQQIMLNVTEFDIESYSGCRYDWLEIRNGGTSASPLIGKYCGTEIPKQIPSHANKLYLFFKSDLSRTGKGFRITWSSAATGCGGVLTSPTGSIISPHYPEPYSRNTECMWKIVTSTGSRIQVIFADIDLEKHVQCLADYVQLFDGLTINSNSLGRFCNEIVEPIKSTSNKMLVKFRSDVAFQGRGFQLQYTTVCHNTVKGYRGVIESPNFPNDYPQDEDCLWEIVVSNRNKINITFSHFELERSLTFANNSCLFDYVEISYAERPSDAFSDEKPTYTKYGKYCGNQNPGHLSLDSDHVQIHFVSDKLLLGSGFRLEWEMVGCGGHLKQNRGTISSPNYPNPYPASVVCEWLIEVDYGNSVEIEFHEINVEKDSSCSFDSIKIYNGLDDTYNLLATFCRQKLKTVVSSTGNFMFVRFETDYSYQGTGFIANFTNVPTKCGGRFTASQGSIFSPNYPKNYNKNETCEYFIEIEDGHSIELHFEDVDLFSSTNCSKNYVKVHDGPSLAFPVLATICGNETPNTTIRSSYNHMYIEFMSHSFFTTKGFLAKYNKACGSRISTNDRGVIDIDQNEFTDSISNCTWTIVSSVPSRHVSLTISYMHGQPYCMWDEDSVFIYNGESENSPLLKSFCGSKIPPTLVSDGSALTILIKSPITFFATYSIYDSECGGTLISSEGFFSTPGYPNEYASDTQCEWTIEISPGNQVTLNFIYFELLDSDDCNNDFLEIRSYNSSGPVLGTFCGENTPENITHVGSLWLLYKGSKLAPGDPPIAAKGFYAEYQLNDYSELTGKSGEIYSPLYPRPYLEYKTFSYKITVESKKRILLSFKEFSLDALDNIDEDCYFAVFQVFDGVDDTAVSLGRYCGLTAPQPLKSSSNIMFINVEYNSPRIGSKFIVGWEEIPGVNPFGVMNPPNYNTTCGAQEISITPLRNFTFHSPGFPGGYEPNLRCEWIFSTIPMNHLTIQFLSLNFESGRFRFHQNCNFLSDNVIIYQKHRNDNDWQLMKTVCKYDSSIFSATDLIKVRFETTRYMNGSGFEARVEDACGGYLTEPTGYIIFNGSTPRDDNCEWNITVRSTKTIELVFEEMNVRYDRNKGCDNYIMVRNGKFPDSPILGSGKYCGSELPEKLHSTGNNLYVKYRGSPDSSNFRLKYQEISASCGGEIILSPYDNHTEISSPNYPNIPQPHIECQWIIRSPPGELLRIDFQDRFDLTFSKNCEKEYVEIRDGGTEFSKLIGRFCKTLPSSQFTTDNMVFIKFFTDIDDPKNGFRAKVSISRCGGLLVQNRNGELKYYNPTHTKQANCLWHIVGPIDHYMKVTFAQMEIKKSRNCTSNFVSIYEHNGLPGTSNDSLLGKYCGNELPAPLTSSTNELFVHYEGDSTGKFILKFNNSQTECGGILNQESGEITSPGYPVMNHLNRICKWVIKAPEGRSITLNILDWDVDLSDEMGDQLLYAYDGKLTESATLDMKNNRIVQSSSNLMFIIFYSRRPSEHRGFKANFSSNLPTVCRGDFSLPSGQISTPTARNYSYSCHWTHNTKNLLLNQTTALTISLNTNYNLSDAHIALCEFSSANVKVVTEENPFSVLSCLCATTVRPVIVRTPFLITKLQASVSYKYQMNFTVLYATHQCGGIVHGQMGSISSPNFPNQPSSTVECAWLLKVDKGQSINITISTMDLGDDCDKSFLEIFNGDLPTLPRIGKYCKNNKPDSMISQNDKVWIEYRWEKGSSGKGFQLNYEAVSSGCGGIFYDKSRIIQTPNYKNNYDNNAECLWIIQSAPGYHIQLDFLDRFHVEKSDNCTNDYLEIFDWVNDEWLSMGRKCGRENPTGITSSSDKMKLLFRTNDRITASGFKAIWNWKCGGKFLATKVPRVLTSAGYPVYYEGNMKCEYVIETKSDVLNLRFLDFNIEQSGSDCKNDNVTIKGRSYGTYNDIHNVYCGNKFPPLYRLKGSAVVTFMTDKYVFQRGFKLEYKDESCGGEITDETVIEVEPSPDFRAFGSYNLPKIECVWNITAPPNQIVVLNVGELNMKLTTSCFVQNLQIFDGLQENSSSRLAQLCGNVYHEFPISSSSNKMHVKFMALPFNRGSFKAEIRFSHGPKEGCGGTLNLTDRMVLESPNLSNLDCGWKIIAPPDHQILIEITELNLPDRCKGNTANSSSCECFLLEIRDGGGPFSDEIERLCPNASSRISYPVISTSRNAAFIRLFLRGKKENAFKATLKSAMSICGPSTLNVTEEVKILTSPGFPSPYPASIKCTYTLSVSHILERISLHFIEFDLVEENKPADDKQLTRCIGDTIEIFEDNNNKIVHEGLGPGAIFNGQSTSLSLAYTEVTGRHVFCGKEEKPFDYYSSSKALSITFTSKNSMFKGSGFKLEYSIAGCNRNYTSLESRVSNGYKNRNCSFSIIVPENRTISIYFNTFYMIHTVNCTDAALVIRDGSPTGKILLNACGYRIPDPIFSFTNQLFVHSFAKDGTRFMMKFDFVYTSTDNGRGCGGEMYNNKGKVYSPLYPNAFRNDTECTWVIKVPVGLQTALKFTIFDIQGQCEQTSVKVKTHTSSGTTTTAVLCQDYKVGTVYRSESSIEITYTSSIHNGGSGWVAQFQAVRKEVTQIS
ncbi:cubilin [Leptinotarsa decemlineata]|uniref:cubilin n=1 Tax=Leptinotarsa decemlineata TaxID=7539 RepID=UPI003D308653